MTKDNDDEDANDNGDKGGDGLMWKMGGICWNMRHPCQNLVQIESDKWWWSQRQKRSLGRWWIMSKCKMHPSQGVRWGWAYCVTLPCPSMSSGLPHSTVHHSRTIGSPYTLHGVLLTASGYTPVHANLYSTENLCGFIENLWMIFFKIRRNPVSPVPGHSKYEPCRWWYSSLNSSIGICICKDIYNIPVFGDGQGWRMGM